MKKMILNCDQRLTNEALREWNYLFEVMVGWYEVMPLSRFFYFSFRGDHLQDSRFKTNERTNERKDGDDLKW